MKTSICSVLAFPAAILMVLATMGCATGLEPAPAADRVAGLEDAAQATVQGVRVVAQAAPWPGPVDIDREVTPLKVRVDNIGPTPLRVRYNEFALVAPDGTSFAALPLARIEGEVAVRTRTYGAPGFYHRGFAVAPYYAPFYPGIDPYPGFFGPDRYYYDTYYRYWEEIELPTTAMEQRVIPEGVIDPGGSLEGWLFFEKIGSHLERVVLRADLVDAPSGRKFAELRIPFIVP